MTKIISIADDAYEHLKSIKGENESFSKVIRRIAPQSSQENLLSLAGSIKDDSFVSAMKEVIASRRNIRSRKADFG